jgi:hypothetical protein
MVDRELITRYVYTKLAEAPFLADKYTKVDGELLGHRRVYSRLKKYVDEFLLGRTENRFIIIPGLRGVGKTTVLFQLYNYLRESKRVEQERILYFSTDELSTFLGADIKDVITAFVEEVHGTSFVNLDRELIILIDEAHYDKTWSQVGKIIYDKTRKVLMIFTGSSALNLETNVDAMRRAKKEMVFPMGFSEYITLQYRIFPPRGMAESLRGLIFRGSEAIASASENEGEIKKRMLRIGRVVEREFEDFLVYKGLPFGMRLERREVHEKIFDMISRVIEKDVFSLRSFSTQTRNTIIRTLTFLALQKPGGTSDIKLAERLKISPTQVRNILDVLEKTHLIFSLKPYGAAGKIVRKPWKYYFLSPTINAAIRFKLGVYDPGSRETLGILAENLVASYLFRMRETTNMPAGIFYDPERKGVDFLLQVGGKIIPLEVGIGEKKGYKVRRSISRYKSPHGIIVSNIEKITIEDGLIYIPITTFAWI